jgi:hypothetical protein
MSVGPVLGLGDEKVPEHLNPRDRAHRLRIHQVAVEGWHFDLLQNPSHLRIVAHGIIRNHTDPGSCLNRMPKSQTVVDLKSPWARSLRVASEGRELMNR